MWVRTKPSLRCEGSPCYLAHVARRRGSIQPPPGRLITPAAPPPRPRNLPPGQRPSRPASHPARGNFSPGLCSQI
ncbi:unnamed protein product, partial [Iphiclides podalirius]